MNTSMTARREYRKQLLITVSAIALSASLCGQAQAANSDADRPVLWIEGGWHFEKVSGLGDAFAPSFFNTIAQSGFTSPLSLEKAQGYSYGADGKISFQPEGSDWIFSASVRYGRAHGRRPVHQQQAAQVTHFTLLGKYHTKTANPNYSETDAGNSETHIIADFQAGKDVGLGFLSSTSTINVGIRFAQFRAKSDITVHARPDGHFVSKLAFGKYEIPFNQYHEYFGSAHRAVSFRGIGPSISWNNSTPLMGNPEDGEVALDWGANAAILFGKQKAKTHHHSSGFYHYYKGSFNGSATVVLPSHAGSSDRHRSVIVPNLGGFAALSLKWTNATVSLGYRADAFFGALDGGFDTRHETTRGFFGPFASISVGLGD